MSPLRLWTESYWQLGCDAARAGLPRFFPFRPPYAGDAPNVRFPDAYSFSAARRSWLNGYAFGKGSR